MAEKKKDAKLPETPEQFYEKAAKLQSIDGLIRQGSFRAENYQRAAELFAKAGDYSDAKKRAEECRRLSAEADQNYKETMYSSAVQKMASKDNMVELESAQKMFREISGYLDSAKREEECAKALEHLELKAAKRRRIITIAAGILIIGVLIFFNTQKNVYPGHVAIVYEVMPDGNFRFLHSCSSKGVVIQTFNGSYYYFSRYVGARRVIDDDR